MRVEIGGLILAAGRGSRYGSDKRRAALPSGQTLLEATLSRWRPALPHLCVVLRAADEPGEQALAVRLSEQFPALAITHAAHWADGMGASLAAGIRDCAGFDGVLIGLGDMPYLQPGTLQHLTAMLQQRIASGDRACILRPTHQGRTGHPVGFGRDHFSALGRLDGDVGARAIIEAAAHVTDFPCDDPGIRQDVDTPQGLRTDPS